MNFRYVSILCTVFLTAIASVPADIVWSGEQNLSDPDQYIDLNNDSLIDVVLVYSITSNNSLDPEGYGGLLLASADGYGVDGSNHILVNSADGYDAALPFGALISGTPGPTLEWKGGEYFSGLVSEWSTLPPDPDTEWRRLLGENGNTYIGISFDVAGSTHYAWVNIALGPDGPHGFETPVTTSWAYESTPDTPIIAGAIPEPSTGILSMIGSLGLLQLARSRRRRKQGCAPIPKCRTLHAPTAPENW
jgi:hypothetical protein